MVIPANVQAVVDELTPELRRLAVGRYAIALGGSYTKGGHDAQSDIDFYVFADEFAPYPERLALMNELSEPGTGSYLDDPPAPHIWGGSFDFTYRGFKIEACLRTIEFMDRAIAEPLKEGIIRSTPVVWTPNGFYNFVSLTEAAVMQPLDDPHGVIDAWKQAVIPYPAPFKRAIVSHFWPAAHFWLDNFHYLSAIQRCDVIYTSGIVHQSLHNFIQVVLALNELYFHGDKKIAEQLERARIVPRALRDGDSSAALCPVRF